jgi:hypothetical protein
MVNAIMLSVVMLNVVAQMPLLVASLAIIIYNRNMFIVHATGQRHVCETNDLAYLQL